MATINKLCAVFAVAGGVGIAHRASADSPPPTVDDSMKHDGPIAPPPAPAPDPMPTPTTTDPTVPVEDPSVPPITQPVTTTTTTTTTTQPIMYEDPNETHISRFGYGWREEGLVTGIGVGVAIGGGITGFTDRTMRDTVSTQVGGLWDGRLSVGTHIPIGLDLSYIGTAANVNTFNGQANGTLVGTTAEAALRWNILPHYAVFGYVFAGIGWQRYDVTNMKFATSDTGMQKTDNVAEVPMGSGVSFRDISGFNVDVRGTFRATQDSTLVLDQGTNNFAKLHTWEASASLGYEF